MIRCLNIFSPLSAPARQQFIQKAPIYALCRRLFRHLLLAVTLLFSVFPSFAQMALEPTMLGIRNFPATAQRAAMQVLQPPVILLNGQHERLSPGSRIRGSNNMLVMSGALVGQNLLVHYVREPLGLIHEVWILNEAETQLPPPNTPKK